MDNTAYPKILTDDVEEEPILDSVRYGTTIATIIKESHPRFSLGIYGEWGSGKSTLMRLIERQLEEDHVQTVWFNAWRYEREKDFAITALMKTIAFALVKDPIYKELRSTILRGLKILGEDALEQIASVLITQGGIEKFKKQLPLQKEIIAEMDRDTIYFDGLTLIETEMKRIRQKTPEKRIVVFIDDLDRCSPRKALEVFESIKVFLDIEGFVFVIGLSHETISKVITAEYKKSGISGEDYIRKVIQIPIAVPEWNYDDIKTLAHNLADKLDPKYSRIIDGNSNLIARAVRPNPRETKIFINNFILINEIFSTLQDLDPRHLLIVQALRSRWIGFYRDFSSNDDFRKFILDLCASSHRDGPYVSPEELSKLPESARRTIENITDDLWQFLKESSDEFGKINDWGIFRRAIDSVVGNVSSGRQTRSIFSSLTERLKEVEDEIQWLGIREDLATRSATRNYYEERIDEKEKEAEEIKKALKATGRLPDQSKQS